jgi:hypothetical protein
MKFAFLLGGDETEWATRPPEETARGLALHRALEEELTALGRFVDGDPLQPRATATTVRPSGSGFAVTDGPFAEAREQLGGFYLIEAASLEEALAFARKLPPPRGSSAHEVRPARTGAQWRGPVRGKQRYMLLLVGDPARLARQTRDEVFEAVDRHYELSLELAAQGRFWGSRSLGPPSASKTLRERGGETVLVDGPFAETREQVAGWFIVACDSQDEAVEIAKPLCFGLEAVEVRPIWDLHDRISSRARSSDASSRR